MINTDLSIEIKKRGLLEIESIQYLFDLYLPIIGKDGAFLYLFLMNSIKSKKTFINLNDLVKESEMNLQDFIFSKKTLESIGLLSSYESSNNNSYLFVINDVETPKNFFNNLLLQGLLLDTIGEKRYIELMNKYKVEDIDSDYLDISAKFDDSFKVTLSLNSISPKQTDSQLVGRVKNSLRDNFSDTKLINYLKKNTQINVKEFDDENLNFAHKIGTLYGLSEEMVGSILNECYNPFGPKGYKFDRNMVRRKAKAIVKSFNPKDLQLVKKSSIKGDSDWIKKIEIYESTSPREFLKRKQNGVDVVEADKNLLDKLAFEIGLNSGMINALIDFVLTNKNGELSKNYVLKLASTLIRKNCKSTLDVVNALYDDNKSQQALSKDEISKPEEGEIDVTQYEDMNIDYDLGDE